MSTARDRPNKWSKSMEKPTSEQNLEEVRSPSCMQGKETFQVVAANAKTLSSWYPDTFQKWQGDLDNCSRATK